ncbi:MAG TPA: RDD family protein [Tepidisphaeraceae bacterium]|jgi:uncharacterized RDD family membrane protein YckC
MSAFFQSGEPMADVAREEWYFVHNGQQGGPVPRQHITDMWRRGEVGGADLVWREGMSEWQPAVTALQLAPGVVPSQTPDFPSTGTLNYYAGSAAMPIHVGFWWRVLAYIIDYLVLLVPGFLINLIFQGVAGAVGRDATPVQIAVIVTNMIVSISLWWLYFALMESSARQGTLGKMAIGAIVTDEAGGRIGFGHATARYFSKILSGIILCIGFMMVGWTQRKQGLHDILAKTFVVRR